MKMIQQKIELQICEEKRNQMERSISLKDLLEMSSEIAISRKSVMNVTCV